MPCGGIRMRAKHILRRSGASGRRSAPPRPKRPRELRRWEGRGAGPCCLPSASQGEASRSARGRDRRRRTLVGPGELAPARRSGSWQSDCVGGSVLLESSSAPKRPRCLVPSLRAAIVPVTPFQQNCALVWSEAANRGAVVDPGGDVDRIVAAVETTGLTVEKILLTHGHIDHAGGATELKERLRVPIEGPHEADRFLLERLADSGRSYGIAGSRNVLPDRWLLEGDQVDVAGSTFSVLH